MKGKIVRFRWAVKRGEKYVASGLTESLTSSPANAELFESEDEAWPLAKGERAVRIKITYEEV